MFTAVRGWLDRLLPALGRLRARSGRAGDVTAAFRALRHRPFALLWTGQTFSRVGDFVYQIVVAWWVLEATGSPTVMGQVLIVTFLPVAVFTLIGGLVVDRAPRVWIMLVSDVGRAGAVLAVAALAAAGRLELWMVFALGLLFGIADAFFQPAYFALVPDLVPEEDLNSANALSSLSFQLGRVLGPAVGGVIVAAGGAVLGLFANGASFVLAAVTIVPLLALAPHPRRAGNSEPGHWRHDLRQGVATVRGQPVLWVGLLAGALIGALLVGPFLVSMPFLVAERFGEDSRIYGVVLAMFPVGFIAGSLWGGRRPRLHRRGLLMFVGMASAGLALAAFGLPVTLPIMVGLALVNGFCLEVAGLAWTVLVQERVPGAQLGRVASLEQLFGWTTTPVAFAVAGWATERFGPEAVFLVGGGAAAAVALGALAVRAVRETD